MNNSKRIPNLHDVIHQNLDEVMSGCLELDLSEEGNICRVHGWIGKLELRFRLSDLGCLIGSNQTNSFGEISHTSGPSIEHRQSKCCDRKLGDANDVDDTNEEKIPGRFLAYFFANQ